MHEIEPFHRWNKYYDVATDQRSPYFGKEYNYELYTDTIYGYYIDPAWDFMGSETLYIKIIYVDYGQGFTVIELIGEWNDALNNDIMHLKRNIIDHLTQQGIRQFVLVGENVLNFHGSDDCYYEEWFEDVEDGWIALVGFRDFVLDEMTQYNIDSYVNYGGSLQIANWRTLQPNHFRELVSSLIVRRLSLP